MLTLSDILACQPVAAQEAAIRPENPRDLSEHANFVGDMEQCILGENNIERGIGEWQRTWHYKLE